MEGCRDFEKELIATKQDLRVLKSFARKTSTQNKLLVKTIGAIVSVSLPHKTYDWENINDDNAADIITCYEIQHQDILSTEESLRQDLTKALSQVEDCRCVIEECSLQLREQRVQLEECREAEALEHEKNLKLTVELQLSDENLSKSNATVDDLRNQLAAMQKFIDYSSDDDKDDQRELPLPIFPLGSSTQSTNRITTDDLPPSYDSLLTDHTGNLAISPEDMKQKKSISDLEHELAALKTAHAEEEGDKDLRISDLERELAALKTAHAEEEGDKDLRISELESMLHEVKSRYEMQLLALRGARTKKENRRQACVEELEAMIGYTPVKAKLDVSDSTEVMEAERSEMGDARLNELDDGGAVGNGQVNDSCDGHAVRAGAMQISQQVKDSSTTQCLDSDTMSISSDTSCGTSASVQCSLGWVEYTEAHSLPPYGLYSPVVDHLLQSWTQDVDKIKYLLSWVECLSSPLPVRFPMGVRLAHLTSVIRDGFLMLLLPIIRNVSIRPMRVYTRISPSGPQLRPPATRDDVHDHGCMFDIRLRLIRIDCDAEPARPASNAAAIPSSKAFLTEKEAELGKDTSRKHESTSAVSVGSSANTVVGGGVTASLYSLGGSLLRPFYSAQPAPQEYAQSSTAGSAESLEEDRTSVNAKSDNATDIEGSKSTSHVVPIISDTTNSLKSNEGKGAADRISQRLANLRKPNP